MVPHPPSVLGGSRGPSPGRERGGVGGATGGVRRTKGGHDEAPEIPDVSRSHAAQARDAGRAAALGSDFGPVASRHSRTARQAPSPSGRGEVSAAADAWG